MSSSSLWIGATFASRTRPITVRAATIGGVTFDGGGGFGSLEFAEGAHDQTWIGFKFANMVASQNGVITFGGYDPSGRPPPHHITLRNITLMSSCRSNSGSINEQGIYFAHAAGVGPHDLLLEDIAVDGSGTNPLWSAIHAYHGDSANPGSYNVTIRRLHVTGTTNAIVLWVDGLHDWLIEGGTITNAADHAISFNSSPASNIVFKDLVSTGSGSSGFSSLVGTTPRGVTFVNDSLR